MAAAARRGIGRTLVELSQNLDHDVGHPETAGMQVEVGRSQSKGGLAQAQRGTGHREDHGLEGRRCPVRVRHQRAATSATRRRPPTGSTHRPRAASACTAASAAVTSRRLG